MGLFNWCSQDPAVFLGLHQWTDWRPTRTKNVRHCINCGFRQVRK